MYPVGPAPESKGSPVYLQPSHTSRLCLKSGRSPTTMTSSRRRPRPHRRWTP